MIYKKRIKEEKIRIKNKFSNPNLHIFPSDMITHCIKRIQT